MALGGGSMALGGGSMALGGGSLAQHWTCPIRNMVTLGHVISGQARFGTAQLHYFKLLCTASSHGKSFQALIRL